MDSIAMIPASINVRTAASADVESLRALAERTFRDAFARDNVSHDIETYVRDAFSLERVRSELAEPASTFLLAFMDESEHPAGYAKLRTGTASPEVAGPDAVEMQRLYVDQTAIGRSVGSALLRASFDMARSAGHRTIWLGVWERNARAISFYEKWGFETVGEHVFRLGSDEQRDLVMLRSIPGDADTEYPVAK